MGSLDTLCKAQHDMRFPDVTPGKRCPVSPACASKSPLISKKHRIVTPRPSHLEMKAQTLRRTYIIMHKTARKPSVEYWASGLLGNELF